MVGSSSYSQILRLELVLFVIVYDQGQDSRPSQWRPLPALPNLGLLLGCLVFPLPAGWSAAAHGLLLLDAVWS